ncbi:MAG: DinB superfamily protein [Acidobacteria bacterium]|nr:MAG: DinB superfamily protein [Acidobacteriota bacterium]
MSTSTELAFLFTRDLNRLRKQIDSFASDDALWQTLPGVINPAGNLALHLEGNLREFVGRQLGQLPYSRTRDLEFSLKRLSREDVSSRLEELSETIPSIIENLSAEQLEMEYPEEVLDSAMTTHHFLVHLYGHLNWHLGQIDYLRRMLEPHPDK